MHKEDIKKLEGFNILVLSPISTYPLDQGNRHGLFSICKTFKDYGAKIDFVYYPFEWSFIPNTHIREMSKQWDNFYFAPRTIPLQPPPKYHSTGHLIDEWWDKEALEPILKYLFENNFYDVFLVNYVYLSKAFEFAPKNTFKILFTHDMFSKRLSMFVNLGITPSNFYTNPKEEKKGLDRADLILAVKEEEARFFRKISEKKVITLPPTLEERIVKREHKSDDVITAGFVGSLNPVNISSSLKFVKESLPILKDKKAKIKILFGGNMCYSLQKELEGIEIEPYFELYGPFKSVEEFYSKIDVIILPIENTLSAKLNQFKVSK